jgi:hypothetical protein
VAAFVDEGQVLLAGIDPEPGPGRHGLAEGGEQILAPGMLHGAGHLALLAADAAFGDDNDGFHGKPRGRPQHGRWLAFWSG